MVGCVLHGWSEHHTANGCAHFGNQLTPILARLSLSIISSDTDFRPVYRKEVGAWLLRASIIVYSEGCEWKHQCLATWIAGVLER